MAALRAFAAALLLLPAGCGRLERECRGVTETANAFIAESARRSPRPGVSRQEAASEALATAVRYDRLARDLEALHVESRRLAPEVERYRALALRSAASLRDVAGALGRGDFDVAREKRVELDRAAHGELPLVARINRICGFGAPPSPSARAP